MKRLTIGMLAVAFAASAVGCGESSTEPATAVAVDPPARAERLESLSVAAACEPDKVRVAVFSPAEVASILIVVIQGDVLLAQTASAHGTSSEVKRFAHRTVGESMEAMARLLPVAGALGANQRDPTASLVARYDRLVVEDLRALDGPSFDVAFATAEIAASARTAALLARVDIPTGGDEHLEDLARLRSAVERAAEAADARLDFALELQRSARFRERGLQ